MPAVRDCRGRNARRLRYESAPFNGVGRGVASSNGQSACAGLWKYQGVRLILEVASLHIRPGQSAEFEDSFREAQAIVAAVPGYVSHELRRCLEREDEYLRLVQWESLDAHEVTFRGSPEYQKWKALLHHYYDPFPTVLHYEIVDGCCCHRRIS